MKDLKIYVVFHHNLENYYSRNMLEKIDFISVNDSIKKDIKQIGANVVLESGLPGYSDMQKQRFNESSAIINLKERISKSEYSYVGFLQYDNSISEEFLEKSESLLRDGKCVCISYFDNAKMVGSSLQSHLEYLKEAISIYNDMYGTSHGPEKIAGPLFSTFFMSKNSYMDMISFYERCKNPIIDRLIASEGIRHIAGFLERFWGVFLNLHLGDSLVELTEGFEHHPEIKDVRNQLWRYQSGECVVINDGPRMKLSCKVFLPDLGRVDTIEKEIDNATLVGLQNGTISLDSAFLD